MVLHTFPSGGKRRPPCDQASSNGPLWPHLLISCEMNVCKTGDACRYTKEYNWYATWLPLIDYGPACVQFHRCEARSPTGTRFGHAADDAVNAITIEV